MKPCPSYPGYAATEDGRIFKIERTFKFDKKVPYEMKQRADKDGYMLVGGFKVHRMVADAFIQNPEGKPQVAHNNGVRDDNRADNLRWATVAENHADKRVHGTQAFGSRHPRAKLSTGQLVFVKGLAAAGFSHTELAPFFGISREGLSRALRGATYQ